MRNLTYLALGIVVASCSPGNQTKGPNHRSDHKSALKGPTSEPAFHYPDAMRQDVVDSYHGVDVADPYRWLEDTDSNDTREWIDDQNKITFGFLKGIDKRSKIEKRLTTLWNYEKYSTPSKQGGKYFFTKNDGLQNQAVLYWTKSLDEEPKVLLNPNELSEDGTTALAGYSVSWNGKLLAYGLQKAGSDWAEWKVREIETGKDLPDTLQWIKFSGISWTHDNKGFFYSRYPAPKPGDSLTAKNEFNQLRYHKLGTPQKTDKLIFDDKRHPKHGFSGSVTEDGRYLIISVWKGTGPKNLLYIKDLKKKNAEPKPIIPEFDAGYSYVGNDKTKFWFTTNDNAPKKKLISFDLRRPAKKNWRDVIPEQADTLRGIAYVGGTFFANYMHNAHSKVLKYRTNGKLIGELQLPGLGSVGGFSGKSFDKETFYSFTSFTQPRSIYRYDLKADKVSIYREPKVDFKSDQYETKQVFVTSKDGSKVPMFIIARKGFTPDGNTPTYLYGYGGFGVSLTPYFSVSHAVWLELGGIIAIPNLRGGGEFGEEWHQAGTKTNKQNVFDDFIASAEWLLKNNYTKSQKLAISGRSNGGLLVGAAMTQRPELFGAALPGVGVMDMLRFHKFTIGWAWVDDYGSPENEEEFKALYSYSPYHNLKPDIAYPATMVTTADHDDRVVPGHSFKFAAALQFAHKGPTPVLIRIETRAGHGGGKPTKMRIEEAADQWAFLYKVLHMGEQ